MATYGNKHSTFAANKQPQKVPGTLFCYGCQQEKRIHSFSKTQVTKALDKIHNLYASHGKSVKRHHTMCKQCTPQQNSTLTCMLCTRTMPLDKFAKAQRRNAEKARCRECMEKCEAIDIDDSEPDQSSEEDAYFNETWDDLL
ncbi:hypothetical protein G9A89_007690 [Geosiphon pyriformis]|nr:hypothetical protein G9A89_007690 [Geosiphon pyriformis]